MEPGRSQDGVDLNQLASEMDDRTTDGLLAAIRRAPGVKSALKKSGNEAPLQKSIQEEMKNIRDQWGEKLTDGGEPQILWNSRTNSVWVSTGDWHDSDVTQAIYEALERLPGVETVEGESESYPAGYHYGQGESDWTQVYPPK